MQGCYQVAQFAPFAARICGPGAEGGRGEGAHDIEGIFVGARREVASCAVDVALPQGRAGLHLRVHSLHVFAQSPVVPYSQHLARCPVRNRLLLLQLCGVHNDGLRQTTTHESRHGTYLSRYQGLSRKAARHLSAPYRELVGVVASQHALDGDGQQRSGVKLCV